MFTCERCTVPPCTRRSSSYPVPPTTCALHSHGSHYLLDRCIHRLRVCVCALCDVVACCCCRCRPSPIICLMCIFRAVSANSLALTKEKFTNKFNTKCYCRVLGPAAATSKNQSIKINSKRILFGRHRLWFVTIEYEH